MKNLILFIAVLMLTACRENTEKSKPEDTVTPDIRWVQKTVIGGTYVLTVDSIEYIVVKYSDGVAITFHRDLKSRF